MAPYIHRAAHLRDPEITARNVIADDCFSHFTTNKTRLETAELFRRLGYKANI